MGHDNHTETIADDEHDRKQNSHKVPCRNAMHLNSGKGQWAIRQRNRRGGLYKCTQRAYNLSVVHLGTRERNIYKLYLFFLTST